jgi:t-SNARE complex subunit (syntaxin)
MSDADARTVALLEELVDLLKTANEQQRQALQKTEQYYVDARARTETAIELQKVAVARQRWFVRVWLGLIVFIVACVAGVLIAVSRYLH